MGMCHLKMEESFVEHSREKSTSTSESNSSINSMDVTCVPRRKSFLNFFMCEIDGGRERDDLLFARESTRSSDMLPIVSGISER